VKQAGGHNPCNRVTATSFSQIGALGVSVFRINVYLFAALLCIVPARSQTSTSSPAASEKDNPKNDRSRVVLKVGSAEVTEAEFEKRIEEVEGDSDPDRAVAKEKKRLGDDYASVLMLSQKAVADHLDTDPEIRRKLEIGRMQILSDAEFAALMAQAKPSPQTIEQYYKAHLADYEQVHIRRLFLWKKGEKSQNQRGLAPQEARERADAILKTSATGGDVSSLIDAFKKSDLGLIDGQPTPFPKGELPPAMEKIAWSAAVGKWTEVQDTANSIILMQLVKREQRPLEEVASLIELRLQNQKLQERLDELKKNAGIWMDERYFGTANGASSEGPRGSSEDSTKQQDSTGNREGGK